MDGIVALLTTAEGRISRRQWWMGVVVLIVISIVLAIVVAIISGGNIAVTAWANFIVGLILLWPTYNIGIKRRHDRDNDGRDLLALMAASVILNLLTALGVGMSYVDVNGTPIPTPDMWLVVLQVLVLIFAIYMLVMLGFLKGTTGPNQYGPDPLGGAAAAAA